ncbi:MAG: thioredoxin family protein [Chitinophagales bacterium]
MRKIHLILTAICCFSFSAWHYNLDEAKEIARKDHKFILLNFSGSDWCGPCIRMHKEIFESKSFSAFADSSLVLVNADFPRMKKNQLSPMQQNLNNKMADQYNSQGKFPYTLLLDGQGKVLRDWDGFTGEMPEEFIREVQELIRSNHSSE